MKKTVTANVSGTVFHIEEDAYEKLQRYFSGIRGTFAGSNGSDEIMADIEARIAELFTERLQGRQVVTLADVDHVMGVMGQPEDFAGEAGGTKEANDAAFAAAGPQPRHRRLFRDPDDHWVGGVLSGIGAYFNFDPLWLRIGFLVIMVAGWGSPLFIYVLLWILVPLAETPADKLSMRGEPVTVDNLKRVFDEGADRFRTGAEKMGQEAQRFGERWSDPSFRQQQYQRSGAQRFVRSFGSVVVRLIGLFLLLLGAVLAFGFIAGIFSGHSSFRWDAHGFTTEGFDWGQLANAWFISPSMANWAWAGIIVFLLIPILGLLIAGIRLLFDVHIPRWFGWILTPLWFISLALLVVIGVRQANEYRQHERVTEDLVLPTPADHVLRIKAMHDPVFGDDRDGYSDGLELLEIGNDSIQWGWAELDVRASDDAFYHLEIVRRASGASVRAAQHRSRDIRYRISTTDSLLALSPLFTTGVEEKLRNQTVSYIVRVPEGCSVRFERNAVRIINDIANTEGTYDGDMVGRTWTMTAAGLAPGLPAPTNDSLRTKDGELQMELKETKNGPAKVKVEVTVPREHAAVAEPAHGSPLGLLALLRSSVRL